ncbi:MAG: HAD-IA family hydrolase [Candidatus Moranbacteria bacterium]|nr:HAD-IA family hydrolase [Candidatus Moranbacteria bacterium]
MKKFKNIKTIIYDLDGTIVDTEPAHFKAWEQVAKLINVKANTEKYPQLRGIKGEIAVEKIFGYKNKSKIKEILDLKKDYTLKNFKKIKIFPNLIQTCKILINKNFNLWICTSAPKKIVELFFNQNPQLKKIFKENVIYSELTEKSKPNPQPLLLTMKMAGTTNPKNNLYIGDTVIDYQTARSAKTNFILYNVSKFKDNNLESKKILKISNHSELIKHLS